MSFLSQYLLYIHQQVTQSATTKTVFGYDDFVTTVDNTVMVFTSEEQGGATRSSVSTASSIISTLEQTSEPKPEPLIEVATENSLEAHTIRPSKVESTSETIFVLSQELVNSEEDDQLTSKDESAESEDAGDDTEEDFSAEVRTEKSVTISSSSSLEPFTSDENKIDTTIEEVGEKTKDSLRKTKGLKKDVRREPSAGALSYKERLKERLAKEKAKLAEQISSKESLTSERRMFSLEEEEDQSYKPRIPRERRFRSRFDQVMSFAHN